MLRAKPNLQRNAPCAGADYLGLTIETVSRQFTKFRKQGLIDLPSRREAVIQHRERLEEIAQ